MEQPAHIEASECELELPRAWATQGVHTPMWSRDGSRLFVEREVDSRWWPWLSDHRADAGALLAIGAAIVLVWWVRRVLLRPRTVGRLYCRGCNHDMNGGTAGVPVPERCQECGRLASARNCTRGRPRWFRLASVSAPALVAAGMGIAFVVSGTQLGSTGRFGLLSAWPLEACSRFASWPLWRSENTDVIVRRVDAFQVDSGVAMRWLAMADVGRSMDWCVSDDARTVAWSQFDQLNNYRNEVCWLDVDTGAARRIELFGRNLGGFEQVCGFTPDGRSFVVRWNAIPDGAMTPDAQSHVQGAATVYLVDVDTGVSRALGQANHTLTFESSNSRAMHPSAAAVGPGPEHRWATVTMLRQSTRQRGATGMLLADLTVGTQAGVRQVPLQSGAAITLAWGLGQAWIEGERLVVTGLIAWQREGRRQWAIDLETGRVEQLPILSTGRPFEAVSPSGQSVAGVRGPGVPTGNDLQTWTVWLRPFP